MSTVGITVTEHPHLCGRGVDTVGNIALNDGRRHRHVCRGQRFRQRHHLWSHTHLIGTEIGTQAAESADDLIVPEPNTIAIQHRLNRLEVTRRRHNDAARATHRLGNHRRDGVGTLSQNQ